MDAIKNQASPKVEVEKDQIYLYLIYISPCEMQLCKSTIYISLFDIYKCLVVAICGACFFSESSKPLSPMEKVLRQFLSFGIHLHLEVNWWFDFAGLGV